MTDDLDRDLRASMRSTVLPGAPEALHGRLRVVVAAGAPRPGQRQGSAGGSRRRWLSLGFAASVVAIAALMVAALGGATPTPTSSTEPATKAATASPSPAPSSSIASMSVSEALDAHAAATLPDGEATIRGFWTNGSIRHSCVPPLEQPGDLEIYCYDGEFGITERDEPIMTIGDNGAVTYVATGPHLTPYLSTDTLGTELMAGLSGDRRRYPPIPIVFEGHFGDPRAADCRPEARQLCLDRFVVDRILLFDLASVSQPTPTPTATPFPSPWPPGLFEATECAGDMPYSFVGWTTFEELGFDRSSGHIWVAISRDPVDRSGEWIEDVPGLLRYRLFARVICYRAEWDSSGGIGFESVPGSNEIHWEDGRITPGENPLS